MVARNKINSKEDKEIIENDSKNAEILNNFSNIVKNLKTPDYSNFEPVADNLKDPTLKAILKYRTHPCILAIQGKYKNSVTNFCFTEVSLEET